MVGQLVDKHLVRFLVLPLCGVLAGCIPLGAGKHVQVPTLEVQLSGAPQEMEIIRPRYESHLETFLSLVKDTPSHRVERYSLVHSSGKATVEFSAESRYVKVFAFSLFPEDPTYGQDHIFFVRTGPADDVLYRFWIEGRKARVERTSLSLARQNWSPALDQPQPSNREPNAWALWQKWYQPRGDFYRAVRWSASDSVAIESFRRGGERDVLSIRIHR